MHSKNSA